MKKRVILLAGGQFQPTACGFITAFEAEGGVIDGIICLVPKEDLSIKLRKALRFLAVFKPSRLRRLPVMLLKKIFGMQEVSDLQARWNHDGENSWDLLKHNFDIFAYAKQHNIHLTQAATLDAGLIRQFTQDGPVIFPAYAGGFLAQQVLDDKNAEFTNAHMGSMPRYRGMNVIEWAVLEDEPAQVAVMVMNEKIDGGDILLHHPIDFSGCGDIKSLRKAGFEHCFVAMAKGIKAYQEDPTLRQPQPKGAKYYYRMHDTLRARLSTRLKAKH